MSSYSPPLHINPKFNATDYNYQDKYMTQYTADLRYAQTGGNNAFSGTNTFVTQDLNDTTTKAATTEFVNNNLNGQTPILLNFTTDVKSTYFPTNSTGASVVSANAGLLPVSLASGSLFVGTILTPAKYINTISITAPISVTNSSGSFRTGTTAPFNTTFSNTISSYVFVITKNDVLWGTYTAVPATGAKQTNTTTITASTASSNYTFSSQQFYGNYTTSFTPDNSNAADFYRIYFSTTLTIQASVVTNLPTFSVTGFVVANTTNVSTHISSITGAGTSSLTLTADAFPYTGVGITSTGTLPTNNQSGYTYVDNLVANSVPNINITALNLARPPVMTYTTLPTLSSNQVGYIVSIKNASQLSFSSSGVSQTIGSTSLSVGVYQFSGYVMGSSGASTGVALSFNATNNVNGFATGTGVIGSANPSSNYQAITFSCIFSVTTTASYFFCASFLGMSSTVFVQVGYANGTVVRIA